MWGGLSNRGNVYYCNSNGMARMTNFILKVEHTEENEAMIIIAHSEPNAKRLACEFTSRDYDENIFECKQIGISHIGKEQVIMYDGVL